MKKMTKLSKVFAKSKPNTYKCNFTVNSDFLTTSYLGKEYFYRISSITPDGINIIDEADNGTEIINRISWSRIK